MKSARLYASALEPTSTSEGFRCFFGEGARDRMAALGLTSPKSVLAAAVGELIRETPGRRTWRIADANGALLFLKQYDAGSGRRGKISRLRAPAEVEALRLRQLRAIGLPVPRLEFACWHRGQTPVCAAGATIQLGIAGRGLDELMQNATREDCEFVFFHQVLPLVSKLHGHGFFHRDLYSGHLIAETLRSPVSLIDVARCRPSPGVFQRLRVKDLAALLVSFRAQVSSFSLGRAFLRYVASIREETEAGSTAFPLRRRWEGRAGTRRLAAAVLRKEARIRHHKPRHDPPRA